VQTLYRFRVVCRSDDEAHIRASVAQALSGGQFVLTALRSEDLDSGTGRVEVIAELQRLGRDDIGLESAVSRLSLEPGVSAVTWSVVEPDVPLAPQED
jgi:putative Mg2+ transporter-C (MgtC) family protein